MTSLRDEIFDRMDELSPAEKKVARTLLANYPAAGLASAAALAKAAGTSTPTVLRLVSRLGIGGYPEFQAQLREEVTEQLSSPVSRAAYRLQDGDGATAVPAVGRPADGAGRAARRPRCRRASSMPPSRCWPRRAGRSSSPAATSPGTSRTSSPCSWTS